MDHRSYSGGVGWTGCPKVVWFSVCFFVMGGGLVKLGLVVGCFDTRIGDFHVVGLVWLCLV